MVTKQEDQWDIVIVGSGVAGLSAGMYAGRLGMKTLVLGDMMGGTITLTDVVENYPGFVRLTGMELAENIRKHAEAYDIPIRSQKAQHLEKDGEDWIVHTRKEAYRTKTVLIATGSRWRKLGVPGEDEFQSKGVHTCALCDGPFYKGKVIGVVGGSDSAAKEALVLSGFGKKVYLLYRGTEIHPEPVNRVRVEEKIKEGKIEIITGTNVTAIHGKDGVESVTLDKAYNGKKKFPVDALFIEIGHIPLSDLAKEIGVKLNKKGEIMIDRDARTNISGVFAAGDVVDTRFKQAIVGVAEGVLGAYSAYIYTNERSVASK